jgi:hypothetical protein
MGITEQQNLHFTTATSGLPVSACFLRSRLRETLGVRAPGWATTVTSS